jgi:hypothetical protein
MAIALLAQNGASQGPSALLTQNAAVQGPSALIRINSMEIGECKERKTFGGYATIPPDAQPELCHLSLKVGALSISRWFGQGGCRTIRFEATLTCDQVREAVLVLSDHPLQVRSVEEIQQRPGSTFAVLKVDDVKIPLK